MPLLLFVITVNQPIFPELNFLELLEQGRIHLLPSDSHS